jgi:hypothetical protein
MLAFPFAAALVLSALWLIQLISGGIFAEPSDELKAIFQNVDWTNSIYFIFVLKKVCLKSPISYDF